MTPENAPTLYDRGAYEKFESSAADMHDHLVRVLGVRENERWIDVATGAGAIALRAARLGADVTGQDLSSRLIRIAAEKAASAGLSVRFEIGDCQQLPDRDEWYDVVSSSVGAMYAPDHRAVARQLARVLRKGGRLGLTAWRLEGGALEMGKLASRFIPPPPEGAASPFDWGRPDYVRELLGNDFQLEFQEGNSPLRGESPKSVAEEFVTSFPPAVVAYESLDKGRQAEMRDALEAFFKRYQQSDGRVALDRPYLLTIGTRQDP
jgi:SAM-dependent methyltransferase